MIRLLLTAAIGLVVTQAVAFASTILPVFPYGPYQLTAMSLVEEGDFQPDTAPSLFSETAEGYSLSALEFTMTSRALHVASWIGAKSIDDGASEAVVTAEAGVMAIPDEGERSGDPVTLYVHLIARSYGGDVAYAPGPIPAQLQVEARVRPNADLPWQSFSSPGVMPIAAAIGKPVDLSLSIRAATGDQLDGPFDSYAAMDLLLYLSYNQNPPPELVPKPIVPGDATLDGIVDGADYTVWADHFLQTATQGALQGDFSNDGLVDGGDYTTWADHFSPESSLLQTSIVPEPSSLWLAAVGGLALLGVLGKRLMPKIRRRDANQG